MQFENLLMSIKLPEPISMLIEHQFAETRQSYIDNSQSRREKNNKRINSLKKRLQGIENLLMKTNNVKLQSKYEEERATIDSEITVLKDTFQSKEKTNADRKDTLIQSKFLFENPASLWQM